jgi:hypothetical protein
MLACTCRDRDAGLDDIAVAAHQLALTVEFEGAVACVGCATVGHPDTEKAFAPDGEVVFLLRRRQVALGHDARRRAGFHARADLEAGGQDRSLVRRGGPGPAQGLVEQVLELGPLALVAGGAQVGDVVRDDLDVEFLGHHAGGGGVESTHDR